MKIKGAVNVNASQEEVWRIFMDPTQFCQVIPGCENARQLDETHYEAFLSIKLYFMNVRSKALGTRVEAEAPRHLVGELAGETQGLAGGFRAIVTIDLKPINNMTNVQYTMDLTLLGRLARLGEPIAHSTAKRITREFGENISKLFNNPGRR